MDTAFAARGDFLAVSGVDSVRADTDTAVFDAGALVLLEEVLAADVTVLVTGFEEMGFLTGDAF